MQLSPIPAVAATFDEPNLIGRAGMIIGADSNDDIAVLCAGAVRQG